MDVFKGEYRVGACNTPVSILARLMRSFKSEQVVHPAIVTGLFGEMQQMMIVENLRARWHNVKESVCNKQDFSGIGVCTHACGGPPLWSSIHPPS